MQAIRQNEFGAADVLVFSEVPDPEPGAGQVRITVAAAGVHLVDTSIRRGAPGPFPRPELPMTPGREVAGVVDAVGAGVPETWLGRRVVAHLGMASGGYAERALAAVESVHPLPDTLDGAAAVALIGTGRTALLVLDAATIGPADVVLVTSAAGGLGALLVQAVLAAGARVVGVAGGPAKAQRVRELGALAVDYRLPDWSAGVLVTLGGERPTVVLDGVGGTVGRAALELLRPGGRAVLFGFSSGDTSWFTTAAQIRTDIGVVPALGGRLEPARLRELETRALAGAWTPQVTTFPLADAARAHQALEDRETTGKVVLVP